MNDNSRTDSTQLNLRTGVLLGGRISFVSAKPSSDIADIVLRSWSRMGENGRICFDLRLGHKLLETNSLTSYLVRIRKAFRPKAAPLSNIT
jgi:hypothetical protein